MFGKNKLYRSRDFENKDTLSVKDVFYTIQGEGPYSGSPSCFIRLAHCSIACNFCDTDFESDIIEAPIDNIVEKVKEITPNHVKLVVLTGGEPLLQPKVAELIRKLINEHYLVQVETSGTVCVDNLPLGDPNFKIVCSPKTGKIHPKLEQYIDYYKYIIKEKNYSDEDGLPEYSTQIPDKKIKLARPILSDISKIYISPMDEYDKHTNKKNLEAVTKISLKYGYKISLQIHKILKVE